VSGEGLATELRPLHASDGEAVGAMFETSMSPPPGGWNDALSRRARARIKRSIETDPGGCWAAEQSGRLAAVAVALVRDGIWVLSLLMVAPDRQSRGMGRTLMSRALEYGAECRGGLIAASPDPRALRLYGTSGFALHPVLEASGPVDRAALPVVEGVRDGELADLELVAEVDGQVRGGRRNRDVEALIAGGDRLVVCDHAGRRGYALSRGGSCVVLAAEAQDTAQALLWTVLADAPADGQATVQWITGDQQWATEVALAARLKLSVEGAICRRGRLGPLQPFLPSGSFL
jgi:hypothetical protein